MKGCRPKLGRKYGINRSQWDLILQLQSGKCKICDKIFDGRINVDHDPEAMVIRGLLCSKCSDGLEQFDDDPERLQKAIDYLKHSNALKEIT